MQVVKNVQETVDVPRGREVKSKKAKVGSSLVHHDSSFFKLGARVLNYSHKFVEEYGLRFLSAETVDNVGHVVSFFFPQGMVGSTLKSYVLIEKARWGTCVYCMFWESLANSFHSVSAWEWLHWRVLSSGNVTRRLQCFPNFPQVGSIASKRCGVCVAHLSVCFLLLSQVQKLYNCYVSKMLGAWDQFLASKMPHTE